VKQHKVLKVMIIGLWLISILQSETGFAQGTEAPRVLVLNSYHANFEWTEHIVWGIRSTFAKATPEVELTLEYMDTKNHDPAQIFPLLASLYQAKYQNTHFDVIITSDNNAFDFLLAHREHLFPGVPVVFCGLNSFSDDLIADQDGITGVVEDIDIQGTLDLALRLHPDTETVAVVSDMTPSDAANRERLAQVKPTYEARVDFIDLVGLPAPVLQQAVAQLPANTVILFFNLYRDYQGGKFTLDEGMRLISANSGLPIYSLWEDKVAHGALGGVTTSGEAQGREAAHMALRILHGELPAAIPVLQESPNVPMFNYAQLQRFDIPLSHLPEGSVLLNEPQTFYYQYKSYIFGALAFSAFQMVIIIILWMNITRRKQAEEALQESEALLRQVIDLVPYPIFAKDADGRFLLVNHAGAQFVGKTVAQMEGHLEAKWVLDETILQKIQAEDRNVIAEGQTQVFPDDVWTDAQGQAHIMQTTKLPFRYKRNKPPGVLGISIDITERQRAKQDLERYADALKRSNEDLQQFAYVVSHDLKAPLRIVKGFLNLLRENTQHHLDSESEEYIHFAIDGIEKMERLIQDLLNYSRINSRGQEPVPTDAEAVLRDVLLGLELSLEAQDTEVTHDTLPTVMADATQLRQLFQNLIDNALKFSNHQQQPRVHIGVERQGNEWAFSVGDNGIGIAAKDQERIFGVFERLYTDEEYEGTGIGLAVCKKIVERHGGRMWVESEVGEGSTFYFTLPAAESADT
jgi:PAS domain S-box-containing protein